MPVLPISPNVTVNVSAASAGIAYDNFNIGLILGKSTVISAATRCAEVTDLAGMTTLGFAETDPEYLAAQKYFAQNPRPARLVVGMAVTGDNAETYVQAIDAIRAINDNWYGLYIAAASLTTADHSAVAAKIEGLRKVYFFDDGNSADYGTGTSDVFSTLKTGGYTRTFGLYSGTAYAGAAFMGRVFGLNTGEDNSAFTAAYKTLTGVVASDLTAAQVESLEGKNANVYITRGTYSITEKGVNAVGGWIDEVIGMDQLISEIEVSCMAALAGAVKIPYTDAGALQFVIACNEACQRAVNRGFVSPGVWNGQQVLDLNTGDTLDDGYLCQAVAVDDVSDTYRQNRISPPVYVCAILTGAIHTVTIQVNIH